MTENGIALYDLAAGWFCGSCGQATSYRIWPGVLTGCRECDEVITRHRCTKRPDMDDLADGQTWECRDCGSRWTPVTQEQDCADCCGECGHQVLVRRWDVVEGPRLASAPRHEPPSWTPFRNLISRPVSALQPMGSCYRHRAGFMVHVKPGCRC